MKSTITVASILAIRIFFGQTAAQRRPGIRLATIEKLATALGVEPWELLKPAQFPPPSNKRGKSAVG